MKITSTGLKAWSGGCPGRRRGKLLILRLTRRGFRRWRRAATRSGRISSRTASWNWVLLRGGNSAGGGKLATNNADGVEEGEPIRVFIGFERGFMDQASDGEVGHHEAVELLANEVWGLAAQDKFGAAQVGFQLAQGGFDFPAFMIESGELVSGSSFGVDNRGDQPIDRLHVSDAFQAVVDDPHRNPVGLVAPVSFAGIDVAQIGAVGQAPLPGQTRVLLDAPEQIGAAALRPGPEGKAEEVPVCQAQHALLEAGKDGFAQCDLTRRVARHLAAEQYVRAILHQGDETDLWKGAAAPAGSGPPESFVVGRFIGDLEGTAVQAHQTPAAVPGPFGRRARPRTTSSWS